MHIFFLTTTKRQYSANWLVNLFFSVKDHSSFPEEKQTKRIRALWPGGGWITSKESSYMQPLRPVTDYSETTKGVSHRLWVSELAGCLSRPCEFSVTCVCALSCSAASDFVTLWTAACQAPLPWDFPARTLERGAISPSRDGTRLSCVSCIGRWVLYH